MSQDRTTADPRKKASLYAAELVEAEREYNAAWSNLERARTRFTDAKLRLDALRPREADTDAR